MPCSLASAVRVADPSVATQRWQSPAVSALHRLSDATAACRARLRRCPRRQMHDIAARGHPRGHAREDEIERGPGSGDLRRSLDTMFPARALDTKEAIRIGEGQGSRSSSITCGTARLPIWSSCMRAVLPTRRPTGASAPACGFNLFHRGAAALGTGRRVPAWATNAHGAGTAAPS